MSFFNVLEGKLIEAPNFVYAPGLTLEAELKDTYSYPVNGWIWYDNVEDAEKYFGVKMIIEKPTNSTVVEYTPENPQGINWIYNVETGTFSPPIETTEL